MNIRVKNIHMIGIGGTGMCGIAEVLLNLGYLVTGSDLAENQAIERLKDLGATVFIGHDSQNVQNAEVVVRSTAISDDNSEVVEARELGIPVIPRAEMLAELMRLKTGLAIAGTHGKTTVTSLVGTIFKEAGFDPTVIIGGRLNSYGANAFLGEGKYLIAEADESDGSFLCLLPIMTAVTNIDADHLDFYSDMNALHESFLQFMNSIPFYGLNVVNGDDAGIAALLEKVKRPYLTFGFGAENMLRAEIISCGENSVFRVFQKNGDEDILWGEVELAIPGRHNILNALGAIGISLAAEIPKNAILSVLKNFRGVGRRFEKKGEKNGVLVFDDYGHHPTEIRATLEAARTCFPNRRLVVAFQPHRFTRTRDLFAEFCSSFDEADLLLLTEIYPASENPIPGIHSENLARAIRQVSKLPVEYFSNFSDLQNSLEEILQPSDVFLTLGAGPIWKVGENFLENSKA